MVVITAEINGLKQELRQAQGEVDGFTKKSKKSFKAFNDAAQQVGNVSKKALTVAATSIAGAAAAIIGLSNSTHELRTNQAMLVSAFDTAGASAETAKTVYNDLFRVLGDDTQAVEASQHLAQLTTDQQALSEWTTITQGVYATFGNSLPLESLTEAINHSAKLGEVQGTLADALEWAGVSVEDFNAELLMCNDEAEREKLIRETLGGLYNDAAANYEKNAAGVLKENEAQAQLNETMAELGAAITPLKTMFAEFGATVAREVAPTLQQFVDEYGAELAETLGDIAEALGDVLSWLLDNWGTIAPIAGVVLGIAAALSLFATVMGVVNTVMAISPVTWIILAIVAAIAALTAIIVVVIKHWDDIKAAASKAVEAIKNAWGVIGEWFNTWVAKPIKSAIDVVVKNWDNIKEAGASAVKTIKDAWGAIGSWFDTKVVKPIKTAIDKVKGFFNFKWELPKIKTPTLSIEWSQSPKWMAEAAKLVGLQGVPKFSVAWNAMGGVFDKPTIFGYGNSLQGIGENGAEAVVPLENNLGWLDKLAGMLNERQAARPMYLVAKGRVLAEVVVDGINDITRQTGAMPLVVR